MESKVRRRDAGEGGVNKNATQGGALHDSRRLSLSDWELWITVVCIFIEYKFGLCGKKLYESTRMETCTIG